MRLLLLLLLTLGMSEELFAKSETNGAVVFMYHRFGESRYPSTNIKMEQFRFELEYLKTHHYNVWPLSKIIKALKEGRELPPKTVALTMDDAYKSVYTKAYPLLKRYGFPFTVFVSTSGVDSHYSALMTWEEMREMCQGGAEFGNHTRTHRSFVSFLPLGKEKLKTKIKEELDAAQKRLESELGSDCLGGVKMLAYPYGEYTNEIRDRVSSLGYVACMQAGGVLDARTNLAEIPRYPMSEHFATPKGFLLKLQTKAFPLASFPDRDHLVGENPPSLQLALQKPLKGVACFKASGERLLMQWIDTTHFKIQAKKPLQPPRDHYTCTARAAEEGWYWYSFFWVFSK